MHEVQRAVASLLLHVRHEVLPGRRGVVLVRVLVVQLHLAQSVDLVLAADNEVVVHHHLVLPYCVPVELVVCEEHSAVAETALGQQLQSVRGLESHCELNGFLVALPPSNHVVVGEPKQRRRGGRGEEKHEAGVERVVLLSHHIRVPRRVLGENGPRVLEEEDVAVHEQHGESRVHDVANEGHLVQHLPLELVSRDDGPSLRRLRTDTHSRDIEHGDTTLCQVLQ